MKIFWFYKYNSEWIYNTETIEYTTTMFKWNENHIKQYHTAYKIQIK